MRSIAETFASYPATGRCCRQWLWRGTARRPGGDDRATPCDLVIVATPIDLARVISIERPAQRVRYELQELGQPTVCDLLSAKFGPKT